MIDIHFEIDGRRVNPRQIGNELERVVYQSVAEDINKKVGSIRDLESDRSSKIIVKGRNLDNLSIEVQGSEAWIEKVKQRLS